MTELTELERLQKNVKDTQAAYAPAKATYVNAMRKLNEYLEDNTMPEPTKYYRKKELQPFFTWTPDLPMGLVSISEADKANGSPKKGDMIAYNPKEPTDFWLIAEKFFKDNYIFVKEQDNE